MKRILWGLAIVVILAFNVAAQKANKPLTNDDVKSMIKNALPESVILSAIKTNDTSFDVSATGLIELKKAGVSAKLMEAMLSATEKKNSAPAPADANAFAGNAAAAGMPNAAAASAAVPGAPAWQPTVFALRSGTRVNLAAEATQIVHTKTQPVSLSSLAADQALNQALQVGMQAAQQAVMKSSAAMSLATMNPGVAIVGGMFKNHMKQAKITYVWALAGGNSPNAGDNKIDSFEVNFGGLPGVNPDQFEPVVVKLSPTPQSNFRLVGATQAAGTEEQSTQQDWPIYSSFVEDRVSCNLKKLGSGRAQLAPAAAMAPGEYAIAFRPVDKTKKFSGEEVAKNQGEGLLFNYAWSFSVK